ncbi:hypothetical protein GGF32_007251 [Allomyces javanicus]|nr:hypothetical protein GGF32_007251 [Allomyces javanicus]
MQFGAIVAGRPVQTDFQPVDATKFALAVANADKANHLVVFVFGDPFPAGYAATVHINLPDRGWQLLGALSNDKPSAMFRLAGLRPATRSSDGDDMMMDASNDGNAPAAGPPAMLGISIEPVDVVQAQLAALPQSQRTATASTGHGTPASGTAGLQLSLNVLQNLYHYVTSFATSSLPMGAHVAGGGNPAAGAFGGGMVGSAAVTNASWIPVKAFEDWWSAVNRKVKMNPQYFERVSD